MINYLEIAQKITEQKLDNKCKLIVIAMAISEALEPHPSSGNTADLKLYFARNIQNKVSKFLSNINELEYIDIIGTLNCVLAAWTAASIIKHSGNLTSALSNPDASEMIMSVISSGYFTKYSYLKDNIRWCVKGLFEETGSISPIDIY